MQVLWVALGVLLGAAAPAAPVPPPAAQEVTAVAAVVDRQKAVPRRPLLRTGHLELTPSAALSLGDPYALQGMAGAQAMVYLNEEWSCGLAADWIFARYPSENTATLRQLFFSVPLAVQRPKLLAQALASWTFLGGKMAAGRSGLLALDTYLSVGGGIATALRGAPPLAGFAALGQHIILADSWALRFELRDALFVARQDGAPAASRLQNLVTLSAGISWLTPGQTRAVW